MVASRATTGGPFAVIGDISEISTSRDTWSGEKCACDPADALATGQSQLSYYMRLHEDAGLLAFAI